MHISPRLRPNRRVRTPFLLGVLLVGSLLTACGEVDEAETRYRIVFESLTHEESLAPIGAFQPGEHVKLTFVVTPKGGSEVDRTSLADFRLTDNSPGEDASAFQLDRSADFSTLPYHTILSHVVGAEAKLCASYAGPEVITLDPMEVCEKIMVLDLADA